MWYLYLDESGDLGFNFANKKPSNFFTVTILVVKGVESNRALIKAVKKTIDRKLNPFKKRHGIVSELKGYGTLIEVKKYFYKQLLKVPFEIFCVTLNKRQLVGKENLEKHRIYNYISRMALEQVPLNEALSQVILTIDKSKNKLQIEKFNSYVIEHLQGRIDPNIPLDIHHRSSNQELGLQAVDMFSWGVFRKYESADKEWFELFKDRIRCDIEYSPK